MSSKETILYGKGDGKGRKETPPEATATPQKRDKDKTNRELLEEIRNLTGSAKRSEKQEKKDEKKPKQKLIDKLNELRMMKIIDEHNEKDVQKEQRKVQTVEVPENPVFEKVPNDDIIEENNKLKKQLEDTIQKMNEAIKEKEAITKQLDETKNNLNDTMLKLENATKERDETNTKLKEKTEEHAKIQEEHVKTKEENTRLKEEGQKMQEENKKMSEEIEELEDIKYDREQIAELTRQMENDDDEDEEERKAEDTFPHEKVLQEGGLLHNVDTKYHKASYDPKQFHPELIVNDTRNQKIDIKQRVDLSSLKNYSLK